jgi:hypothetical protein
MGIEVFKDDDARICPAECRQSQRFARQRSTLGERRDGEQREAFGQRLGWSPSLSELAE